MSCPRRPRRPEASAPATNCTRWYPILIGRPRRDHGGCNAVHPGAASRKFPPQPPAAAPQGRRGTIRPPIRHPRASPLVKFESGAKSGRIVTGTRRPRAHPGLLRSRQRCGLGPRAQVLPTFAVGCAQVPLGSQAPRAQVPPGFPRRRVLGSTNVRNPGPRAQALPTFPDGVCSGATRIPKRTGSGPTRLPGRRELRPGRSGSTPPAGRC